MNIPLSIDMANALHNRFLYTCPLQLPIFAFLLTNEGLYYYRRFYEEDSEFVDAAINGMVCYQIERDIDADVIEINCNAFKDYLEIFNIERFSSFSDVLEMWEFYEKNDPEIGIPTSFFTLAKEVLQIPSSEAAVERLFTFLSDLTSNKMCNSKEQTL